MKNILLFFFFSTLMANFCLKALANPSSQKIQDNEQSSSENVNSISLKLSGKMTRIPLPLKTNYTFNSVINIDQHCDSNSYLEIDESIVPYLDMKGLKIGMIKMLNPKESYSEKINAKLITQKPLLSAKTMGEGIVRLNCVDSNSFSLSDTANGLKYLNNFNTNIVNLEFNGKGDILFTNAKIDNFHVEKQSFGALDVLGKINYLDITNHGIGQITIEYATNSQINNFGKGTIYIRNESNIIKINSQGGNVVIHDIKEK